MDKKTLRNFFLIDLIPGAIFMLLMPMGSGYANLYYFTGLLMALPSVQISAHFFSSEDTWLNVSLLLFTMMLLLLFQAFQLSRTKDVKNLYTQITVFSVLRAMGGFLIYMGQWA